MPALLTMVAAQLLDLSSFVVMVRVLGPGAEANPIVGDLLGNLGLPGIVLAKLALILLVGMIACVLASGSGHRERWIGALVLGWAILAGIIGGWSNALTITAA